MKKTKNPISIYLFVILSFFFIAFLANTPDYEKLETKRLPAMNLQKYDINMYNDYFVTKKHKKNLKYKLSIDFWSNKNDEKMKRDALLAAKNAFKETFIQQSLNETELHKSFAQILKENLLTSYLDKFVKRLRFLNIMHGKFNIRFNFSPEADSPYSFQEEFSSNQLMTINKDDKLSDYISNKKLSLQEKVFNLKLAKSDIEDKSQNFSFRGGSILINFELLDMIIDIGSPIPNPMKNAIKGTIKFRRFFEVAAADKISLALHDQNIDLGHAQYIPLGQNRKHYMTVDIVKSFNLKEMLPSESYALLHFGVLKSENKKDRDIETGVFKINGKLKLKTGRTHKEFKYSSEIKELYYKFGKNKFSSKSKISTKIKNARMGPMQIGNNKSKMKQVIRDNLLTKYAEQIMERLDLKRFHKKIGK